MPVTDKIIDDIHQHRWQNLRAVVPYLHPSELADLLETLPVQEQAVFFRLMPEAVASKTFEYLDKTEQQTLIRRLGQQEVATLLNGIAPDDRTAFLEELPSQVLQQTLRLLTDDERAIAQTLLGYPTGSIGRCMTPYYVVVWPDWTVEKVLTHIRQISKKSETIDHIYVEGEGHRLIDDLRIAQILFTSAEATVASLMDNQFVSLQVTDRQEEAIALFKQYDRTALPVITDDGVLVGIVTADDVLDIIEQADTEDIQKFGGMESLDLPYTRTPMWEMVKKRAGWLIVLFLGEMLTATAMGYFEGEIEKAVVLALFVPLINASCVVVG